MQAIRENPSNPRRRGMTLIETVTALACLAILVPLIVAATGSTVRPNRERMCAYRLGQLGSAMLLYTIENEGYIPGSPGTSGAALDLIYNGQPTDLDDIPIAITQTWDWAAPLAGYLNVELSPSRAERVERFRFGEFWCPSNNYTSVPYNYSTLSPFQPWRATRMLSYNSCRNFLLYADDAPPPVTIDALWSVNIAGTTELAPAYYPRLDQLGTTEDKVFLADGSRYTSESGDVYHDVNWRSSSGGMYSDGGPTLQETYLRSYILDLPQKAYSYRHKHGDDYGINAIHYDGHVSWMSETTSRHPRWWYPTGTTIPFSEMNAPTRTPLIDEILQDPNFEYHVP
ncbi:MAG: type II secretion system protein [Phycisphaerales bacterium]|nr:type II secretion system protein [Phycisphaerales bacterium]